MGTINVIYPGLLTSVQDEGRYGYQQFGVPVSGVMDSFSHRVANILVGNDEKEAVLEVTMLGPKIVFENDSVIAITGGDLSPMINGKAISMWESIYVKKGDQLSFGGIKSGCRSYIAFAGGIDVDVIMGSKSTYMKGKIGGFEGRALKAGDIVKIGVPKEDLSILIGRKVSQKYIPKITSPFEVRVVLGPQDEYFTQKGINTFLSNEYIVTNECDRMGFRLDGEAIEHVDGGDIISDGIAFGAIQIPGHGKPIIMMADRQTTGGYTKIANVISSDLYKIAQAKPNDKIRFKKVGIKEAQNILRHVEDTISAIKKECALLKMISIKKYHLKINGKSYTVQVEEVS
ncbi:biotin-dependent carboxyltransferase family protein [Crassaminicella thermophila]|uniref:Biotin-dependent carboxyltransferase family protein n=1 Tax=Crassaminicella thermophila TaxID=2599308 RepID=A0A5C0SDR7_CRATE|nr:biotin-dependent carboxyltransferase family protein [Crassaminicella thermophila]QEK11404.1 biotin-dependent carboxyltransferase family protein [Crassaminicella thermophila]